MKKLSAFLFFSLLISMSSYAQVLDSIIKYNDNTLISKFSYGVGNYYYPLIFHDYDSKDNNWVSLESYSDNTSKIYRVDNNMLVVDSLVMQADFKLNDKKYDFVFKYLLDGPTTIDSIYLDVYDIGNNKTISKLVYSSGLDTNIYTYMYVKGFINYDKDFVLVLRDLGNSVMKLMVIDTLGNMLNSNVYKMKPQAAESRSLVEKSNRYELLCSGYNPNLTNPESIIYFIDKTTLQITDTLSFTNLFGSRNALSINDSITTTLDLRMVDLLSESDTAFFELSVINTNTLERRSVNITNLTINTGGGDYLDSYIHEFAKKIDFINPDSIYYCYASNASIIISTKSQKIYGITVMNFGINGNYNFDCFIDFDSLNPKYMNGIQATSDGGVLISVIGNYMNSPYPMFIKVSPDGFVGLTEVNTGKKEGLKVYPNPAKDFVLVDIEADKFVEADIEIYDLGGRMVHRSKLSAKVGNRIDVSDLKAGVYSYRVALNRKGVSGKIVIGD